MQLDLRCMLKGQRQQSALVAFVVRRHALALVLVIEVLRALRYELFHTSTQIHGPTAFLRFATYGQPLPKRAKSAKAHRRVDKVVPHKRRGEEESV